MPSFTSYAQNFEDVMLWRALKHVEQGRYIDIGAQHPVVDSVSKAFHERGWKGVHVEPVRHYADMLRADRPDDTVLEIAISDQDGMLELQIIPDSGLSTGVKHYADSHQRNRGFVHQSVMVPMLPIRTAFASIEGEPIHWMKIDIEGLEEAALRGWDSQRLRPWVVVIEATIPLSAERVDFDMDGMLEKAEYNFVYWDGLNRFYVANEHPELNAAFQSPPNVFDGVLLADSATSSWCNLVKRQRDTALTSKEADAAIGAEQARKTLQRALELEAIVATLREALAVAERDRLAAHKWGTEAVHARAEAVSQLSTHVAAEARRAERAEHEVHALRTSTSWRVTSPLRIAVSVFRGQLLPHRVDRIAMLARRYGLFAPGRMIYRAIRRAASGGLIGTPIKVDSSPTPQTVNAAAARFEGAATLNVQTQALSDDARRLLRRISPARDSVQGVH